MAPRLLKHTIEIQVANWQGVLTEDGKPGGTFRTFFVCTSEKRKITGERWEAFLQPQTFTVCDLALSLACLYQVV